MPQIQAITERVKQLALESGFESCGVAPILANSGEMPELGHFAEWIAAGRAGEMSYLEARNEAGELKRAALRNVAPWAKSVIVCAINYNSEKPYSTEIRDPSRGWISRYAWFAGKGEKATDYHEGVLARLRRVEAKLQHHVAESSGEPLQTRCYVDTGPIVERVFAKYAGIGWLAKNTCVINQHYGSWLFLGTILTSIELLPEEQAAAFDHPPADRCGSCTRCIEACPTAALVAPYQMDARRCISYLTIEKRGSIPEDLRAQIGNNIFGCDICQDVCPWNGHAKPNAGIKGKPPRQMPATRAEEFQPREELIAPKLAEMAKLSREEFNKMFRGSPIKRTKYQGFRRNTAIAMGNSGDAAFVPFLQEMAKDEDDVVAEHARWALQKITSRQTT